MDLKEKINEKNSIPMQPDQIDAILAFYETHDKIGAGKAIGLDPKRVREETLGKLVTSVNSKGPAKTAAQIDNWWRNARAKAKKYNGKKNAIVNATGNPADERVKINPMYERILTFVGKNHGNVLALVPETGHVKTEPENFQRTSVITYNGVKKEPSSPTTSSQGLKNPIVVEESDDLGETKEAKTITNALQTITNVPLNQSKRIKRETNVKYAQTFAEYSAEYKRRSNKTETRARNTENLLSEGNENMKLLVAAAQDVAKATMERNALLSESNDLLRQILPNKRIDEH